MVTNSKKGVLEGLAQQGNLPVDNIPAQLTENEYVIPADVVVTLGQGDPEKGIAFFDELVSKVRARTQGMMSKVMGVE